MALWQPDWMTGCCNTRREWSVQQNVPVLQAVCAGSMQAVCPQPRMRESRNPRRTIGRASEPSKQRCGFPPAGMHPGGLQRESGSGGPLQTACVQYARMRTASGGMIYPYIGTTKQHRCRYVPFDHAGSCAVSSSRDSHHAHSVCIMAHGTSPFLHCRARPVSRQAEARIHACIRRRLLCLSGTDCHGKDIPPVMRRLLPRIWPRGRDTPSQGGGTFPHSFPAYRNPAGGASSAALLSVTLRVSRRACCTT